MQVQNFRILKSFRLASPKLPDFKGFLTSKSKTIKIDIRFYEGIKSLNLLDWLLG